MPWDQRSRRRTELPADWHVIRRDILNRDQHRCQLAGPHCTVTATECDHIGDKADHSRGNLQAACATCHSEKTTAQGHDAMRALRAKSKHPLERHPGLR